MKRHISFWGLFSFLWIFIACTQINSPSEENYSDTNNSSSKTEYCTFTLSVSKDSAVRVVYPSAYDTSTLYYKFSYLDPDSNNTNYPADGSGATYTQISTKTFTLATGNYVFALDAYSDSACSKKILECTKNVTLSALTSSVPLKLKSTDAGSDSSATGSVSIKVNLPSSSTVSKVAVKVVNLTDTSSSVDSKELTPDESGTSKSVTYTNASLPTGNYIIYFTLSGDGIEETVIPELVVVATGQQSSNADSPIEVSEDQVNTNIIYVSSSGTTFGVGTKSNPFASVQKALDLINSKNKTEKDWAICISGSIACSDTLTVSSTLKAKSLVIFGTTDTSTDCLVGNGSQTTLALENEIPVTITNLCITGGGMGGIFVKGSGKVEIVGSAVTGNSQSGIRIASSSSSDVEIKESIVGGDDTDGNTGVSGGGILKEGTGTLTIIDSTVRGNKSTSSASNAGGGGIYVAEGTLILGDKANIIENSSVLNGGGILVKDGSVKIKGKVTIKDNTKEAGSTAIANNVYLASDKLLTLAASLSDTGSIGISTASIPTKALPVVLTSALATYSSSLDIAKVFHSDLEEYEIKKNTDGEAILTPAEPLVSVAGTVYYSRESAVNAIKDASGEIDVVLLSGATSDDLGRSIEEGTIAWAIKSTSASGVSFSVAEGVRISIKDSNSYRLFDSCRKLLSADLRGFETSEITSMYHMFMECSILESVNLSTFDTSKVTSMDNLFNNCYRLKVLDLRSFETPELKYVSYMFSGCSDLTKILASDKFVTTSVTSSTEIFRNNQYLVGEKGTKFNLSINNYGVDYARIDGGESNPGFFTGDVIFMPETNFDGSEGITGSEIFISGRNLTIPALLASDHELTQEEYEKYCKYGKGTGDINTPPNSNFDTGASNPVYPAYGINFYDMLIYCNLRSKAEGLTPVYSIGGRTDPKQWSGIVGDDSTKYCGPSSIDSTWDAVSFNQNSNGWRLPTEAEWEFLARGGNLTNTDQFTYSGSDNPSEVGWYSGENSNKPTAIKQKLPNTLGLYDMSGNVFELCWDWSGSVTATTPATGNSSGERRLVRGGGCTYTASDATVATRSVTNTPEMRWANCGARIVRNAQ